MRIRNSMLVALISVSVSNAAADAQTDTNQIMGTLGYPLGTEITVEGKLRTRNGMSLLVLNVSKVNGKELSSVKPIVVSNLDLGAKLPTNTIFRLKVVEKRNKLKPDSLHGDIYPDYYWLLVVKVISPKEAKIRTKSPNKVQEDTR